MGPAWPDDNYHAENQPSGVKIQSFEMLEQKYLINLEQLSMVSRAKSILDKLKQLRMNQMEYDGSENEPLRWKYR